VIKVMKAYYRELHGLNALIDQFVGDPAPRRDELDDADWRRGYEVPDDPTNGVRQGD
jgi:hypothetical protein